MHSRVCSATIEQILINRPCSSASNWKSTAHTTFGASAVGASTVEDPDAFASPPLRDPEPFVTPQALDLLVVHHPSLTPGVVIRPPVPVAGMLLRPRAQPVTQRAIRVGDRVALERATVRGPAQPGQTARHPLAHPRLALEVIDGGAAPARA